MDNRLREIDDLTSQTLDPNFWNDPKRAESIQRKIGLSKKWLDEYAALARKVDDLEGLYEFQKEGLATESQVDAQVAKTTEISDDHEFRNTLQHTEEAIHAVHTTTALATR